jgi:hypothetical protein
MDKQQVENVVTDTVAEAGDAVKGKLDQGKGVFEGLQASAGEAEGKATALVREVSTAGSQAAYLKNGGTLEKAGAMANHASTRTTQLYDRRRDEVSLDEVERIVI